jgi:hypothetical protein
MKQNTINNQPVYPAGMEERLAKYKAAFLEKVKKWRWDEPENKPRTNKGRKAKPKLKPIIDPTNPRNAHLFKNK